MAMNKTDDRRVLMLGVGGEILALDATTVREIMDPVPVTVVPGARSFVPGVINVRGSIVPLADLRIRFGMEPTAPTPDTRYVVIEAQDGDDMEPLLVALIADKVHAVTELSLPEAGGMPRVGMKWPAELVRGVASWQGDFAIVPDVAAVLN